MTTTTPKPARRWRPSDSQSNEHDANTNAVTALRALVCLLSSITVCHVLMNADRFDNGINQSRDGVLRRFDMHGETELMQRC